MPRLHGVFETSTYFAFGVNPATGEISGPDGTGVIVSRESASLPGLRHLYAVTNHHISVRGNLSMVRLNTTDGKSRRLAFEPEEWTFLGNGHDIAVIDITDEVTQSDEISAIPETMFVTDEFISRVDLGLGEDVFMVGMFADFSNSERNAPFSRFGNLSRMADPRTPIKCGGYGPRASHVVDMRSRTGFSGSPVWVFRTPSGDLEGIIEDGGWNLDTWNNLFVRLLGVHCGQFPEMVKASKSASAEIHGDQIKEGDELWIPGGMTVVVPACCISELLNSPSLEAQRRDRDTQPKRLEEYAAWQGKMGMPNTGGYPSSFKLKL